MARRRRRISAKSDGAVGVFVVVIIVGVVVYDFVALYYQAILAVAAVSGAVWLGVKWVRWRKARAPIRAAMPPPPPPPPLPPPVPPWLRQPASSRNKTGSGRTPPAPYEAARPREYPRSVDAAAPGDAYASDVRIRPIIDAPGPGKKTTAERLEKARWIAPGEAVTVAGVTVAAGMFYLGAPPPASSSLFDVEPSFVNPGLNVAKNRSPKNDPPTYYPSYSKITPGQRRGFLQWMAGGRSDPEENLSLVFLFFYGLEYRLFKEGAVGDAPQLVAEVERLLAIHGQQRSFMYYASRFLAFARAYLPYALGASINLQIIPQEMPLDARIHLGGKLAGDGRHRADDALVWAVSSPISWRKRWPNDQRDVFEHYWRNRFAARFPAGLSVPRPRERIRAVYQPSSRSFEVQLKGGFESLPDPVSDPSTPETLKGLVDECWEDGGSYLGAVRRRDEQSPLSASLLLPAEVWIERNSRLLNTFANHLANAGTDVLVLPVIDIFKAADMSVSIAPKTLLAVLRRCRRDLWSVGVGLEPDGNYADAEVSVASKACLFRIPRPWNGAEYRAATDVGARLVVDIGILYAETADNDEPETRARIAASVAEGIGADELERTRLDAYASMASPSPERQPRLLKKASQLSDELRATAARAVIEGVATKKRLPVQLIRQLEKVYKALSDPDGRPVRRAASRAGSGSRFGRGYRCG